MAQLYTDQARTTLATGILAAGTSLTVSSNGELFPVATVNTGALDSGDWFKLVLDDGEHFEVVVVRTHASGGDTFSNLLRGQEGTMARDWDAGAVVGLRVTAADMDQAINNRVEKVAGKGLSQEDYTTAEKNKLDGIAESAAALGTATPSALGTANAGVSAAGAHEDHVHPMPTAAQVGAAPAAHVGAGGTAHANATTSADGFMSSADKTKLNGIAASAAALGDTVALDLGTASAGSGSTAARIDHRHKLPTAAEVGAAPSAHVGSGGTAHANATTSVDGFMSAADKTKLNGVASGATANATDAQLRDRSTHTGTQAQSTVTNLTIDLAARVNRQDNYATVASGVINLGLETELYHITVSGNVTMSVSNAPSAARVVKRLVVQYGSGVITWPASFRLPTPMPTFAAGKAYVFSIEQSPDSGVYFLVPGPEYTYP